MTKTLPLTLFLLFLAGHAAAQSGWSVGGGVGPFGTGDFIRRTMRVGNEGGNSTTTIALSAKTRVGGQVYLEDDFTRLLGFRLRASFVNAPLSVKGGGGSGVALSDGRLTTTTFSAPLLLHLNRDATFRFHLLAGPAYAMYRISQQEQQAFPTFHQTRSRWGVIGGGGISWWLGPRLAIEGEAADVVTSSPFERSDYANATLVRISRPNNVNISVGLHLRL